ncbi:MAG: hypothetical protein NVS2B3_14620 [Vulcanimicrobiaceae bacterium]
MASIDLLRNDPNVTTVVAGDTIFSEGDPGDVAFVVTEGEIVLTRAGRHLENVSVGGIFGEMALIDRKTRSGDAVVGKEAKNMAPKPQRFLHLVQNTPFFAIEVMHVMAERLRRMDGSV